MSVEKKETMQTVAPVEAGEVAYPEKLSLGKKILYHLWDADQHLKSPEVNQNSSLLIQFYCSYTDCE
jgi:hypothetical protein